VIGDGVRTIRQLIDQKNQHPWRGDSHKMPLTKISFDEITPYIGSHRLEEILPAGSELELLGTANLSRGGEAFDVTDTLHPSIAELAVRIADMVELSVCGVDMRLEGATLPAQQAQARRIEINASPGLRMHTYPSAGQPRNVAACILDEIVRRRKMLGFAARPDQPIRAPLLNRDPTAPIAEF